MTRIITIKASSCRDCDLLDIDYDSIGTEYYCAKAGAVVVKEYKNKLFHPDCPMKPLTNESK